VNLWDLWSKPAYQLHQINALHGKTKPTRMWANAQRNAPLPNIGGAICSTPQSLANAHY